MEMWTIFCLVASLVAIVLSLINFVCNIVALVELRSFMKSTHKVEYIPLDPGKDQEVNMDDILKKDLGI